MTHRLPVRNTTLLGSRIILPETVRRTSPFVIKTPVYL